MGRLIHKLGRLLGMVALGLSIGSVGATQPVASQPASQESISEDPLSDMDYAELRSRCGSVSLYLVARYHDLAVTFEAIETLLPPSGQGTSMLELKEAAESIGLSARALAIAPQDVTLFSNPMIARATRPGHEEDMGHFLVLVPVPSKKGCWVLDPPKRAKWAPMPVVTSLPSARLEVLLLRPARADRQAPTSRPASP